MRVDLAGLHRSFVVVEPAWRPMDRAVIIGDRAAVD
jgi:hypothetical protein